MSGVSSKLRLGRALAVVFGSRALTVVLGSTAIFFASQFFGPLLLIIVLVATGSSQAEIKSYISDSTWFQFAAILLVEAAMVGLVYAALRITKRKFSKVFNFALPKNASTLLLIAKAFLLYFGLSIIAGWLLTLVAPNVNPNQAQEIGFEQSAGLELLVVFAALCIFVPIGEELLFRGLLFGGLKKAVSFRYAVLITSLLFGAAHLEFLGDNPLNWAAAVNTAVFSIALCWLYERSRTLAAPIVLHSIKNAIAFMYLFVL